MNGRRWTRFFAGLLLVVAALTPRAARAQGMYYKEIEKDGRVYVFNLAVEAEAVREVGGDRAGDHEARPTGPTASRWCSTASRPSTCTTSSTASPASWIVPRCRSRRIVWRDGKTRITNDKATSRSRTASRSASPRRCPTTRCTLPGTGGPGRQQGLVPHPPRQVQDRRLVLQAVAQFEVQLNWPDVTGTPAPFARGREHQLGHLEGQEEVQGAASASSRCPTDTSS